MTGVVETIEMLELQLEMLQIERKLIEIAMERFKRKTKPRKNGSCLQYTGTINKTTGFGHYHCVVENCSMLAHRFSYMHWVGSLIAGMQIDHQCRVRSCVKPEHLEQVTCSVNLRRRRPSPLWGLPPDWRPLTRRSNLY